MHRAKQRAKFIGRFYMKQITLDTCHLVQGDHSSNVTKYNLSNYGGTPDTLSLFKHL